MFVKRILWNSIFFIFTMFLISCNKNKQAELQNTSTFVNVVEVKNKVLDNTLNNFGSVTYKSKNDVTNLVAGTINNLKVKEGDYVKKGEILCVLRNVQMEQEKRQYESSLESARAALDIQVINLKEQKQAVESRLLSLEKSKLNIKQKELELEAQKKDFESQKQLHEIGGVTDVELEKLEISVKSSETDIEILKKEYEISSLGLRDEDLIDNDIIPSSNEKEKIEQLINLNSRAAEAQVTSAQAQVDAANQQLESVNTLLSELIIKAPVNGIVGAKNFENGEYVKENETILTLIDTSSVYVAFYVQEQDMVSFEIGAPITLEVPSINKKIDSVINEISPIADSQSGNFAVKSIVKNPDGMLKPGMFVRCSLLKGAQEEYPCVTETVLISNNDKNAKVFCIVNHLAVIKSINIKAHKDGMLWIESGITEGDFVINKPSPFLKEGQYVESNK